MLAHFLLENIVQMLLSRIKNRHKDFFRSAYYEKLRISRRRCAKTMDL